MKIAENNFHKYKTQANTLLLQKVTKKLLQSVWDITKCNRNLLQSASGISKCDKYDEMGQKMY